jgi:hypothetical protein
MSNLADFANADLDDIVEKLTTDEAISLIAGVGFWWTAAVATFSFVISIMTLLWYLVAILRSLDLAFHPLR